MYMYVCIHRLVIHFSHFGFTLNPPICGNSKCFPKRSSTATKKFTRCCQSERISGIHRPSYSVKKIHGSIDRLKSGDEKDWRTRVDFWLNIFLRHPHILNIDYTNCIYVFNHEHCGECNISHEKPHSKGSNKKFTSQRLLALEGLREISRWSFLTRCLMDYLDKGFPLWAQASLLLPPKPLVPSKKSRLLKGATKIPWEFWKVGNYYVKPGGGSLVTKW